MPSYGVCLLACSFAPVAYFFLNLSVVLSNSLSVSPCTSVRPSVGLSLWVLSVRPVVLLGGGRFCQMTLAAVA